MHLKFKMVPVTLYMTVSVIDRYLQYKQVRRSRLQLVGVAALLVSVLQPHLNYPLSMLPHQLRHVYKLLSI